MSFGAKFDGQYAIFSEYTIKTWTGTVEIIACVIRFVVSRICNPELGYLIKVPEQGLKS